MPSGGRPRTLPPMPKQKRLTYANVVATLALVFAMSGGAVAASHYLITSTKQISPKVIKKLKGKAGPQGPAGKAGAAGQAGQTGKEGPAGQNLTAETPLPSGHSESGTFSAGGGYDAGHTVSGKEYFGYIGAGITFVQPLATPIEAEHHIKDIRSSSTTTTECPGPGRAEQGYLCLYDYIANDVHEGYGYSTDEELHLPSGAASPGVVLYWEVEKAGEPYSGGTYTVTAP